MDFYEEDEPIDKIREILQRPVDSVTMNPKHTPLWFVPSPGVVGDPTEDMIGAVCEFIEVDERFPDGSPKSGVCQVKRWMDLPGGLEVGDVDRALGVTTVGPAIPVRIQDQHDE